MKEVVEQVTQPNVELNGQEIGLHHSRSSSLSSSLSSSKAFNVVEAMPLCWGNAHDEKEVANVLNSVINKSTSGNGGGRGVRRKKKKNTKDCQQSLYKSENISTNHSSISLTSGLEGLHIEDQKAGKGLANPDIILIGDVAYQHKPGKHTTKITEYQTNVSSTITNNQISL